MQDNETQRELYKLEEKLESLDNKLVDVKLALVTIQTLMTERQKQNLPERISKLEQAQNRIIGYGTAAILFIPLILKSVMEYIKGVS
jgi:hypothetical protein